MIELHTWTTPNGRKVSVMLEECGLPYTAHKVNIGQNEQFKPEFLHALFDAAHSVLTFQSPDLRQPRAESPRSTLSAQDRSPLGPSAICRWAFRPAR